MKTGRPASIPETAFGLVLRLYSEGNGYRRIARLLEGHGVFTTKSSVERLVRGLPPYASHTRGV